MGTIRLEVLFGRELLAQLCNGLGHELGALANGLALRLVGNDHGHIRKTPTLFLDHGRIGEDEDGACHGKGAPDDSGRAQQGAGAHERNRRRNDRQERGV